MFDPMSDEADIRRARSQYNARKTESSLIAWLCSDEWTDVSSYLHERGMARGAVVASTWCGDRADVVSGEIDVPCHPHCRDK